MTHKLTCKSCGHALEDTFCTACGEKRFDSKELSIKRFLEETFEGLVHFDNKYFRTLRALFTMPGQLSLNYVEGRRARFMKPVQFFVITNLIFFILIRGNPFSLSLYNYITYGPFIFFNTRQLVHDKIVHLGMSPGTYTYIFNEKMQADSKELIFVFIPICALICWLLFLTCRRRFVEHLVFSTHFITFVLCLFFLQSYLITWPYYLITQTNYSELFDGITGVLTAVAIGAYFAIASRKFYKTRLFWSILTGLVVGGGFLYIMQVYRMLLFYKIIYL